MVKDNFFYFLLIYLKHSIRSFNIIKILKFGIEINLTSIISKFNIIK
jgi:hypothetical protein